MRLDWGGLLKWYAKGTEIFVLDLDVYVYVYELERKV